MSYVIVRIAPRGIEFVTRGGSASSYTTDIRKARRWPTEKEAQKEACGNEHVRSVDSLLLPKG